MTESVPAWKVSGQVIVISGASKGIGLGVAQVLLARGARVALLARNNARLQQTVADLKSDNAIGIAVDACSKADMERAMEAVVAKWGRIDGIINNVGFQFARRLEVMPEQEVRNLVELNLISTIFGCQVAIPHLRRAGGGRIINVSSASVRHHNEFAFLGLYSSCKAAVDHLTAELREELRKDNIMVTMFSPGGVMTGSIENFDPEATQEAFAAWLEMGPTFTGATTPEVIGEAMAHCFEYPPGVGVEIMEVKPNLNMPKMLESDMPAPQA